MKLIHAYDRDETSINFPPFRASQKLSSHNHYEVFG